MTPTFRLYIAQSIDGFIASADGTIDWLEPFPASTFGFDAFIARIGAIVMGRASYEQVLTFGDWPYPDVPTLVLTSRRFDPPRGDVEAWTAGLDALVAELARREVGEVWVMGGARTIGAFLNRDRIDRIELFVLPLLLGAGVPLHAADQPKALRLSAAEPLAHGVVRLEYTRAEPAARAR